MIEPSSSDLRTLLTLLAQGERSVDEIHHVLSDQLAAGNVGDSGSEESIPDVRVDLDRAERCGFPEVVYAPGKSNESIISAFQKLHSAQQNCLATRCETVQAEALCEAFPEAIHNAIARTVRITLLQKKYGKVVVVSAGTSDRPVAEEAMETLNWMGVNADLLMDVGVAGPQRFLSNKHLLRDAQAVVVVAGMEGALPSVVAGWVPCPVIAVPTSVGYGASFGGVSALLGMLNSCASNVAVVNIDAGFKGAYLAGMIARQASE